MDPKQTIETVDYPGLVPYAEAYERQVARRKAVAAGEAGPALMVLEHSPVVTLGRDTDMAHLLHTRAQYAELGIDVVEVDRGGDVTYHGPGQLTAYPILDLRHWRQSVRWYLRSLEEVLIRVLAVYGLPGERVEGLTGVWVNGAKIAQVGIGLRDWVTFHGIALNVDPEMSHFDLIVPCGIPDRPVVSMAQLLGAMPDSALVRRRFVEEFLAYFQDWQPEVEPTAAPEVTA